MNNKKPDGHVVVLVYYFPTNTFHEFPKPFKWSKGTGNRMNFEYSQGLFQGMRVESLSQFFLLPYQDRAEMVTTKRYLDRDRAKFAREVLKAIVAGRHIKKARTRE